MPMTENYLRDSVHIADRVANIHPEDWRRKLKIITMRKSPLLALMQGMGGEETTSRIYHWWQQPYASRRGVVTGIYLDSGLSAAYSSGGISGQTLYIKMSEAHVKQCVATDKIVISNNDDNTFRQAYILAVVLDAANSYLAVRLLVADTGNKLAGASGYRFFLGGNAQEEGAGLPTALYAEPVEFQNQAQIFMASAEASKSEIKEKERVSPGYWNRSIAQARARFNQFKELDYLFGVYGTVPGEKGKQVRMTRGIYNAINTNEPNNIFDYTSDDHDLIGTEFGGITWNAGAGSFLNRVMEFLSRKGEAGHKTAFTSSYAIMRINDALLSTSHYKMGVGESRYGVNIRILESTSQQLRIVEHPLFTENPALQKSMLITEKHLMKEKTFRGTEFIEGDSRVKDGRTYESGKKAGFESENGLIYWNLEAQGWINNIGENNAA